MTYEKLEILSRIYNTLLLVNTKGEDTLTMADCLRALPDSGKRALPGKRKAGWQGM